ncbi:transcriptional regulator [Saccharomonospora sp. CUA-673]|uniref:IclR family transcriptional regulator n=1 Tax=Saccharomonospora sp. CUA-673 TaxID=1904969 RepID=UPI000964E52C|nr:IclR family transcriptional regulator [Saccharomonospora sp. CUA-673]OLT44576.1 transcriptional regulator [Saccharomonospora sp. CUA-673]
MPNESHQLHAPRRLNSVGNALRVLALLAENPDGLGVSELATRLGLGKSTAHLLLATMADHDFVERRGNGTYRLGIAAFEVGSAVPESSRFGGALAVPMRRIADRSGEAVSLAIHRGRDAIIVQRFESASVLRAEIRIGTRMPVHSCGSGKLFLSEMDADELDAMFPTDSLPAITRYTLRTKAALLRQLEDVRKQGYATTDEEYHDEVRGIAVPVRDRHGRIAAALSVAGPVSRFKPWDWLDELNDAAGHLSETLGTRPSGM